MKYIEDGISSQPVADVSEQNTVFLIGDSIRVRYCEYVKKELEGTAHVVYPAENCRFTQYVLTNIYDWAAACNPDSVAVVQFNCGHWDIAHWRGETESLNDIPTYKNNLARIIRILKKLFPHAKIVFATTTTMHPDGIQGLNRRSDEEIAAYNQAALQVCSSFGDITINDLYSVSKTFRADMFADYCHPTPEAAAILGKVTADCIRKLLLSHRCMRHLDINRYFLLPMRIQEYEIGKVRYFQK